MEQAQKAAWASLKNIQVLLTWEGALSLNSLIPYTSFPKHITLSWIIYSCIHFPASSWVGVHVSLLSYPYHLAQYLWMLNKCVWGTVGGLGQGTKQNLNKVFWVTKNLTGCSFSTRDRAWMSSEFGLSYPRSYKPSGWTWPGLLYARWVPSHGKCLLSPTPSFIPAPAAWPLYSFCVKGESEV